MHYSERLSTDINFVIINRGWDIIRQCVSCEILKVRKSRVLNHDFLFAGLVRFIRLFKFTQTLTYITSVHDLDQVL